MIYVVCAVFDSKAGAFIHPQNFRRKEEAVRSFSLACKSPDSDFYKYAEDYVLFELGSYNDETGAYLSLPSPLPLIRAVNASDVHSTYYSQLTEMNAKLAS